MTAQSETAQAAEAIRPNAPAHGLFALPTGATLMAWFTCQFILGELFFAAPALMTAPWLVVVQLPIAFTFFALIMLGIHHGSRLAWQYMRMVTGIGVVLSALSLIVLLLKWVSIGAQPGVFAAAAAVHSMLLVLQCVLLLIYSKRETMAYFGLECSQCGACRPQATDFFFRRVVCRCCRHEWD